MNAISNPIHQFFLTFYTYHSNRFSPLRACKFENVTVHMSPYIKLKHSRYIVMSKLGIVLAFSSRQTRLSPAEWQDFLLSKI